MRINYQTVSPPPVADDSISPEEVALMDRVPARNAIIGVRASLKITLSTLICTWVSAMDPPNQGERSFFFRLERGRLHPG